MGEALLSIGTIYYERILDCVMIFLFKKVLDKIGGTSVAFR